MSAPSGETAEPDLTAVLDMVFQLITFFLLVTNFKAASMDLNLSLPVLGSARPAESQAGEDLLVLNINAEGQLKVNDEVVKDVNRYIQNEAQGSFTVARQTNPNLKFKEDLPTQIMVRADKETKFKALNKIISTCQDYGYRNFALKAMNREDEGN